MTMAQAKLDADLQNLCASVVSRWRDGGFGGLELQAVLEQFVRHEAPRLLSKQLDPDRLESLGKEVFREYLASDDLQNLLRDAIKKHAERIVQDRVKATFRVAMKNAEFAIQRRVQSMVDQQVERAWKELAPEWMRDDSVNIVPETTEIDPSVSALPISALELRTRTENCLLADGVITVGDLVRRTENNLRGLPNMGKASIIDVVERLSSKGLSLWKPPH